MNSYSVNLPNGEAPKYWFNLGGELKTPMQPPLGPDGKPVSPEMLQAIFPSSLIEQEISQKAEIAIPDEVARILSGWRPTPLHRAYRLEQALGTPARIYYKNESVSPPGSHKPNTAVAQAYYNKLEGVKRLTTETGAGQWGSALAYACAQVGLECKVYMVRISYDQKPLRKEMMRVWGADCIPSPSDTTKYGRNVLEMDPGTPGSLGIAISEAIEEAVSDPTGSTKYSLGSVLNHVLIHQSVIGLETKGQLDLYGEDRVDTVIGCVGGGSNFAGLAFPFVRDKMAGDVIDIIPVEPSACPTMTRSPFVYDFGDTAQTTPLLPMHSLGHTFIPAPIHAGGLRYHGVAPLLSHCINEGLLTPRSGGQLDAFQSALLFAQTEGIIVAPETSFAVNAAITEAKNAKEAGEEKVIIFSLSGHGLLDLNGYRAYMDGSLTDYVLPGEVIAENLKEIEHLPKPAITQPV